MRPSERLRNPTQSTSHCSHRCCRRCQSRARKTTATFLYSSYSILFVLIIVIGGQRGDSSGGGGRDGGGDGGWWWWSYSMTPMATIRVASAMALQPQKINSSSKKIMTKMMATTPSRCSSAASATSSSSVGRPLIRLAEPIWRQEADTHARCIRTMLQPGLLSDSTGTTMSMTKKKHPASLNPHHPVYNFLMDYYGLKGAKGVRRLTRWSPSPGLLLLLQRRQSQDKKNDNDGRDDNDDTTNDQKVVAGGILLEGATEDDFQDVLHRRGAQLWMGKDDDNDHCDNPTGRPVGILYSPAAWLASDEVSDASTAARVERCARRASSYLWYRSILKETLDRDPIWHCYNLHEWAMQYQPMGAPPPPSSQYQAHLPLRVSRHVINDTVERKGTCCTHVDAVRFFADAAVPLNQVDNIDDDDDDDERKNPQQRLDRNNQPRLEQPGCLHAHMDLLKMTLKLQPFCDATLLRRVLEVALDARRLDVAASPYDATTFGVEAVRIETPAGRAEYKRRQMELARRVEPVRRDLLKAYDDFLTLAALDEAVLVSGARRLPKSSLRKRHNTAE